MKAIVCEMCGSQEMVKKDGMYVCGFCGTKYTVEEAKKLITEITGTVKIDKSEENERYLQLARQAKKMKDWKGTVQYYDLVKQSDPSNIEAIFYSAYGRAFDQEPASMTGCFSVMEECLQANDVNKYEPLFRDISQNMLITNTPARVYSAFNNPFIEFLNNVFSRCDEGNKQRVVYLKYMVAERLLMHERIACDKTNFSERAQYLSACKQVVNTIRAYNSQYPVYGLQRNLYSEIKTLESDKEAEKKGKKSAKRKEILFTAVTIVFSIVVVISAFGIYQCIIQQ